MNSVRKTELAGTLFVIGSTIAGVAVAVVEGGEALLVADLGLLLVLFFLVGRFLDWL